MLNIQSTLMYVNGFFGLFLIGGLIPLLIIIMAFEKHHDTYFVPGEGKSFL